MALSTSEFKNRWNRELKLFGKPTDNEQTDVISDATRHFVAKMDKPIISASLSVTTSTKRYDVPSTLRKVKAIRDSSENNITADIDKVTNDIVLDSTPTAAATYTVYGSPKEVRTNLDTIIAAISEDYEMVLWQYITAMVHKWAKDAGWVEQWKAAEQFAGDAMRSDNYDLDTERAIKIRDTAGRLIADTDNYGGWTPDINDQFESDL